jgi:hypothetical protein
MFMMNTVSHRAAFVYLHANVLLAPCEFSLYIRLPGEGQHTRDRERFHEKSQKPVRKAAKKAAPKPSKAAKKVSPIPKGYHTATPYLVCRGAAEAIEFYKKAFGAREILRMAMPDGRVGHAEIQIGDSRVMLGDESPSRVRERRRQWAARRSTSFCT